MQVYRDGTDATEKSFFRFSVITLDSSKLKYSWQTLTVSIALVSKSFINNLLMTKSSERKPDIFIGHTSRPYKSSTGKHLYLTICNKTSSDAILYQQYQILHLLHDIILHIFRENAHYNNALWRRKSILHGRKFSPSASWTEQRKVVPA